MSVCLAYTQNGVPDDFFLTSNMHKIHFRPELRPDPAGGAHDGPQTLIYIVRWGRDTPTGPPHTAPPRRLRRLAFSVAL